MIANDHDNHNSSVTIMDHPLTETMCPLISKLCLTVEATTPVSQFKTRPSDYPAIDAIDRPAPGDDDAILLTGKIVHKGSSAELTNHRDRKR